MYSTKVDIKRSVVTIDDKEFQIGPKVADTISERFWQIMEGHARKRGHGPEVPPKETINFYKEALSLSGMPFMEYYIDSGNLVVTPFFWRIFEYEFGEQYENIIETIENLFKEEMSKIDFQVEKAKLAE